MAEEGITIASSENDMLTIYTREKVILPYAKMATEFIDSLQESMEGMALKGNVLEFKLRLNDAWSLGMPDDTGDGAWAKNRRHRAVKAQVTKAQFEAALMISLEAMDAGEGEGSFTGDPVGDAVENTLRVFMWHKNIMFLGYGTGRLAVVAADVVASDTITLDLPWGAFGLEEGLFLEATEADTGGTVQNLGGGVVEVEVLEIDVLTHTIVVDTAITVSAGWGFYVAGTYGKRHPNGLQAIVDNGALTSTVFNLSRAANPKLNATVMDTGALQDYTEDLIRDGLVQGSQRTKSSPTHFWSNAGVVCEHYRYTQPDRVFQIVSKGDVPGYHLGSDEGDLAFHYQGRRIPFKIDRTLPARELYGWYAPGARKHTLRNDDWLKGGGGAGGNNLLHYAPADGGGTLSNRLIGSLQGNASMSHKALNANIKWGRIRDRVSARD